MSDHTPHEGYRFLFGDEYLDRPRPAQNWIIKPLVPVGGYVNVYGKPKVGKSNLSIGMSLAVANDACDDWLGFPVLVHGPVLYLQADTPEGIWAERLQAMRGAGADFSLVGFADQTLIPYPFNALGGDCDTLAAMIAETGIDPVMVVMDTTREIHQEDENQSHSMTRVMQSLRAALGFQTALILNSHARKGGQDDFQAPDQDTLDTLMDDNRGSNAVSGKMDTVIKVTKRYLHYEGRQTGGYHRTRIRMNDVYLWELDDDPVVAAAKDALRQGGEANRQTARTLAQSLQADEEQVRSVLRRLKRGKVA